MIRAETPGFFGPIEEGESIGRPPFDPENGNLWIDRETEYLLYIYNQGESFLTPGSWLGIPDNSQETV